ncbi:MAG: hypothetical protein J6Y69_00955 [Treponema sp.]|nr:hypothetical protein [Treponema sp.]
MDRKTIIPDYKIMRMILNQCLRRNQNNVLFTVLIYVLLYISSTTIPVMISNMMLGSSVSLGMLFLIILLLLAGIVISQYLTYGKDVIVARMVEKKHITIGYLFNGFRDKTKRVLKASLLFLAIFMGVGLISGIVSLPFIASIFMSGESIDMEAMQRTMLIFSGISILFTLLVSYPFIFTWILMYRMPEAPVLECFGLSAKLVFSQFFRIIGFLFYCCWKYIVILAIFIPLDYFLERIGFSKAGMGGSIFAILFTVLEISAEINMMMRISLAVPIYLFSMTGVLQIHLSEYTPPSQETAIEQSETEQTENGQAENPATTESQQTAPENKADNGESSSES